MRALGLLFFLTACAAHEPTRVFVASTTPPAPKQAAPSPPTTSDNCDDAIVAYHELLASGRGPNHPSVTAAKIVFDACISGSPPPGMRMHGPTKPPMSCGEAALERAKLLALGKGPNHPALMVVEARLGLCASATPSTDECLVVAREHADLEVRGYGSRHPDMIANDAKRVLCPSPTAP